MAQDQHEWRTLVSDAEVMTMETTYRKAQSRSLFVMLISLDAMMIDEEERGPTKVRLL